MALIKAAKKKLRPYPDYACDECGIEANRLTCLKNFGAEPLKKKFDLSTYHQDKCDWCGKQTLVTEARDYFYPDFYLLKLSHRRIEELEKNAKLNRGVEIMREYKRKQTLKYK